MSAIALRNFSKLESRSNLLWPLAGFVVVLAAVLWTAHQSHINVLAHGGFDSYTVQAMAWRSGHIALPGNISYLELAIYHGRYWVSFPPVPAVPMWVLTFFFGANTPSGAVNLVYFFGALGAIYALFRRYLPAGQATLWAVFIALGGTILSLAQAGPANGGVWYQAQLFALLLTAVAFLLVDGERKVGWYIGLACLALAVGCRPFNLIYAPVLLWMLSKHLEHKKLAILPYLVAPAVIAAILGIYNAVRFGSPLEFGHTYLPELALAGEGMFILGRVPQHIKDVFQMVTFQGGKMSFPLIGGFAVYLTNPMIFVGLGAIGGRLLRRKIDLVDVLLVVTVLVHAVLLLSHRTNGGWQYGTRYLTDLLPAVAFAVARGGMRIRVLGAVVIGALIVFNLMGMVFFQTTPTG